MPISTEKGLERTMGDRIIGLVYYALGFIDNRRYMFSEFLEETIDHDG